MPKVPQIFLPHDKRQNEWNTTYYQIRVVVKPDDCTVFKQLTENDKITKIVKLGPLEGRKLLYSIQTAPENAKQVIITIFQNKNVIRADLENSSMDQLLTQIDNTQKPIYDNNKWCVLINKWKPVQSYKMELFNFLIKSNHVQVESIQNACLRVIYGKCNECNDAMRFYYYFCWDLCTQQTRWWQRISGICKAYGKTDEYKQFMKSFYLEYIHNKQFSRINYDTFYDYIISYHFRFVLVIL